MTRAVVADRWLDYDALGRHLGEITVEKDHPEYAKQLAALYQTARRHKIPCHYLGPRQPRFRQSEVDEWLMTRTEGKDKRKR